MHVTCARHLCTGLHQQSELQHPFVTAALLPESIGTALCLLPICVKQFMSLITLTFVMEWVDFIRRNSSFIGFTHWNPNIASIPLKSKPNTFLLNPCYLAILQEQKDCDRALGARIPAYKKPYQGRWLNTITFTYTVFSQEVIS